MTKMHLNNKYMAKTYLNTKCIINFVNVFKY